MSAWFGRQNRPAETSARNRTSSDFVARAADLAGRWRSLTPAERRAILTVLVKRIDLLRKMLEIHILPGRLLSILLDENDRRDRIQPIEDKEPSITLLVPARLKRTGMETRLLIDGASGSARRKPDHSLYRVLAHGALVARDAPISTFLGSSLLSSVIRASRASIRASRGPTNRIIQRGTPNAAADVVAPGFQLANPTIAVEVESP